MTTKLTLNIEELTIVKAKRLAKNKNTSLSKLIENYLQKITHQNNTEEEEITPLVKSLSGIIKQNEVKNLKDDYSNYLSKKYK
jgi:hemerythrin superfamily protein